MKIPINLKPLIPVNKYEKLVCKEFEIYALDKIIGMIYYHT